MDPSVDLEGRKNSSPPGFDPGPSSPSSLAIPTELPGRQLVHLIGFIIRENQGSLGCKDIPSFLYKNRYCDL